MSTSPGTVEAQLALAIGQVNAGQVESALRTCEAASAEHAPNPAVLQLLAVLLVKKGDVARARECIDASLALRPGHGPSLPTGRGQRPRLAVCQSISLLGHLEPLISPM